jgi:hypothetical protein
MLYRARHAPHNIICIAYAASLCDAKERGMPKALDVLQSHPTWEVIDPSKLTTYMECPRKYFYKYVLGWNSTYPNNHLTFGTCWHLATEHLSRQGYTPESLEEAKAIFLNRYREDFPRSSDSDMGAKRPDIALNALYDYFHTFKSDVYKYKLLYTEISAVVLVSPILEMVCKLDWIGKERETGRFLFIDHKTSQRHYSDWGSHWTFTTQMLLYRHVMHCLFPKGLAPSRVRCAFFYKSNPGDYSRKPAVFEEAEISKSHEQMTAFLARTDTWLQHLSFDMHLLEDEDLDARVMTAFVPNETACFNYGKQCEYFTLCEHWSNPLHNIDRMPYGMRQSFWDPRENELIRERIDITANHTAASSADALASALDTEQA